MNFNPDLVSQAQEVIFSRKTQKQKPLFFPTKFLLLKQFLKNI